jgi:hypothetical protein
MYLLMTSTLKSGGIDPGGGPPPSVIGARCTYSEILSSGLDAFHNRISNQDKTGERTRSRFHNN